MKKTWIFANKTELDIVHEVFGEETLFGRRFMGPIHNLSINDHQIMFYADPTKFIEWLDRITKD